MSVSSIGGSSGLQAMQQLLFSTLDTNQDGQISSDEFSAMGQSAPSDAGQTSHSGGASASDRFGGETLASLVSAQSQSRFDAADADGDGKLSVDEIAAGIAAKAPPGASGDAGQMAANYLEKADTDGDGSVSQAEFAAARPAHHGHGHGGPPPAETADASGGASSSASAGSGDSAAQNPADTNGDGVVSASELAAYMQGASGNLVSGVSDLMKSFLSQLDSLGSAASSTTTAGVMA